MAVLKVNDIMNVDKLRELIDAGFITARRHNDFPLEILNYSKLAQYDEKLEWGNEMNLCRGFIYNYDTMEVVAVPFRKFWNINDTRHPETLEENLPKDSPLFLDKLDGSLAILYSYDGHNYVATRGSFHSTQADWANNWLHVNYPGLQLPKNHTVCAEIIFDENKIVVDYDFEGITVLGIIHHATCTELSRDSVKDYCRAMGLPIVKEFRLSLADCLTENIQNREGYVLTYSNGLKVKVKFSDYCELHAVVTKLNPHAVWEILRTGNTKALDEWLLSDKMPGDFKTWLNDTISQLRTQFNAIQVTAMDIFLARPVTSSRKELAAYFTQDAYRYYSAILFSMLDGKQYHDTIWKKIEPVGGKVFKVADE